MWPILKPFRFWIISKGHALFSFKSDCLSFGTNLSWCIMKPFILLSNGFWTSGLKLSIDDLSMAWLESETIWSQLKSINTINYIFSKHFSSSFIKMVLCASSTFGLSCLIPALRYACSAFRLINVVLYTSSTFRLPCLMPVVPYVCSAFRLRHVVLHVNCIRLHVKFDPWSCQVMCVIMCY